ncbi:serine hydrolase [Paenibacillus sp. 598K]|uniref:serine hydrolase domain-containing protein n=1 Tax=Paenibacillus sp. 598K TaxID=1117987 RepID=UPI000FF916E9|nr:serine hydrolase domain-containing protein [Paenibacillus sp. 598K]GBF75546.1 serine hydrolase [Paenibacillus sp. 598K]
MFKKLIIVGVSATLALLPLSQAFAQEKPPSYEAMAQRMASELIANYGVSAVQYAIMDEGSIVLSGSAGVHDRATNQPVAKDTMFAIGSVSKMHVSAATMMLADAKLIDIDQPLVAYIKEFKMADERYKDITPRMLMNHSSGLYGTHYGNSMLFDDNDTENHDQLLTRLQSEHLKAEPGEFSVYCNDGFQLLELLVERVSGISYSEFVEKRINEPLQLTSTKTPLDDFDRERLAKTYFPTMEHALPVENPNVIGAGGLYSTAEELTKFAEVLIGNRPDVLSEQSVKAMQQAEYRNGVWISDEPSNYGYGLGWDAIRLVPFANYGITAMSKGGDTMLYHADLTTVPDQDISIAVITSGGSSIFNSIFTNNVLLDYLQYKDIIQDTPQQATFKPAAKVDLPAGMRAYEGLYGMVGETVHIEMKNSEIRLPVLLGGLIPEQTYSYTGDGQFTSSDGRLTASFVDESNGKTYLKLDANLDLPGLGGLNMITYAFQKLDKNPVPAAMKKVWEERNGKNYYAVDEKITSLFYLALDVLTKNIAVDMDYGYATGTRIVDANQAVNAAQIPMMNGRDAFDLNFHQEGQTEYLTIDGFAYIDGDAVKPIYAGKTSIATIQSDGHAVWYKIDAKAANKTMTVQVPEGGGFAVYDANGLPVNLSIVSKTNTVALPEGGRIVFGGPAGTVFKIGLE